MIELPELGPRVELGLDPPFNRAHRDSAVIPLAQSVGDRMWPLSGLFFGVDEAVCFHPRHWVRDRWWDYWSKACVWVDDGFELHGEL